MTGTFFAQLAVGVLGVLVISGEYGTGMIRSSLTVVPARLPMLWAKLAVFAAAVFLTMLIAAFAALFVGQALLSGKNLNASITDAAALRSVIGAALYLTVAGMTAVALGALLRNTAAAITTFVAVFFVIPPLTNLLPSSWTDHFVQFLPSNAGAMLLDGTYGVAHPLSPWTGFGVMCAFAVVLIAAAAWRLRRTDAGPHHGPQSHHQQPLSESTPSLQSNSPWRAPCLPPCIPPSSTSAAAGTSPGGDHLCTG